HVVYSVIDTSGALWTGLSNGPTTATVLGYEPAAGGTSGRTLDVVGADPHGADGFTFDTLGNMWVTGGTTADPAVARYPAAMFASGGTLTPDFTLDSAAFNAGIPGAKVVTFDQDGN